MEKILVSACLLGKNCKYSGGSNYSGDVADYIKKHAEQLYAVSICPEVMGGLPTPRAPAELCGNTVMTKLGEDVTAEYEKGAEETIKLAEKEGCRYAILKERSPSCGSGSIYDGTFSGTLITGDGKTAARLKAVGIKVYGETQLGKINEPEELK